MIQIAPLSPADYDEVMALWRNTEGLTLRNADSREEITSYLARNPGLSFIARDGGRVVGAVLAGTDGRRGYLQHLAVAPSHRSRGLGRTLAERAVEALNACGIKKCHLMVRQDNSAAREFWEHLGWGARADIIVMSLSDPDIANA